jgi:hypothetical protein
MSPCRYRHRVGGKGAQGTLIAGRPRTESCKSHTERALLPVRCIGPRALRAVLLASRPLTPVRQCRNVAALSETAAKVRAETRRGVTVSAIIAAALTAYLVDVWSSRLAVRSVATFCWRSVH